MNQTPIPQKMNGPRVEAPQKPTAQAPKSDTDRARLLVLLASLTALVLAFSILLLSFMKPLNQPSSDTSEESSEPEESEPPEHIAVTYPTSPSRGSYLLSGNGTAIDGSTLSADFAILVSLSDYSVVASLDSDARIYPASMTKIMTLIVACEEIKDASVKLPITEEIIKYCQENGAEYFVLDAGDRFVATDLLYAVGVKSAADACLALADHIAGSEEKFVALMNAKAKSLGLTKTNFANCTGLDNEENYSTAREMAIILAYALDNPFCREILSTDHRPILGYYEKNGEETEYNCDLYTTILSRLSGAGYEEKLPARLSCGFTLLGAKTGYTDEGKFCLASFLEGSDGELYITVTAKGDTAGSSITDMEKILNKHT